MDQLKSITVQFFTTIYTDPNPSYSSYHLSSLFPPLCDLDLSYISQVIEDVEIHKAFHDMKPMKALGIDGLHAFLLESMADYRTIGLQIYQGCFCRKRNPP